MHMQTLTTAFRSPTHGLLSECMFATDYGCNGTQCTGVLALMHLKFIYICTCKLLESGFSVMVYGTRVAEAIS